MQFTLSLLSFVAATAAITIISPGMSPERIRALSVAFTSR